jgi:hypothetical protein
METPQLGKTAFGTLELLPPEVQRGIWGHLDAPSAGRLALASKDAHTSFDWTKYFQMRQEQLPVPQHAPDNSAAQWVTLAEQITQTANRLDNDNGNPLEAAVMWACPHGHYGDFREVRLRLEAGSERGKVRVQIKVLGAGLEPPEFQQLAQRDHARPLDCEFTCRLAFQLQARCPTSWPVPGGQLTLTSAQQLPDQPGAEGDTRLCVMCHEWCSAAGHIGMQGAWADSPTPADLVVLVLCKNCGQKVPLEPVMLGDRRFLAERCFRITQK